MTASRVADSQKPTRDEFVARLRAVCPSAELLLADRGLTVRTLTRGLAQQVELLSAVCGLDPKPGADAHEVRIFGFRRRVDAHLGAVAEASFHGGER